MTKLEAIKGTRERWESLSCEIKSCEFGGKYRFIPENECLLCEECDACCCDCVWNMAHGRCATWIRMFTTAATDEEASLIRDTIIGMLFVLEGEYKNE